MKNIYLGGFLLFLVIILWVGSSATIQFILKTYPKPYFLTYMTTSMFSWYLLSIIWKRNELNNKSNPSLFETAIHSLRFCPLWFFANYSFNVSLNMTSIASNTILASTSGIFTLIFLIILSKATPTAFKWLAVTISFTGVVCISLSEENSNEGESLIGDIFAILGAILYAIYSVCLKDLGNIDIMAVFGCVGIINFCILMPGIFFLDKFGIENFELPDQMETILILGNAILGSMISDLIWAWSVEYLTPTICTLGLSLTIPLSMFVESMITGTVFHINYVLGAGMIIAGFIMITISDYETTKIPDPEERPLINDF